MIAERKGIRGLKRIEAQPLISVVVPVYKSEPYLKTCVDSILGQTYANLEVILVDDGSPDNCPAICDAYAQKDPRVTVIHKANRGVSSARNAALEILRGDYVAFVDSDDYVDGDFFLELSRYEADVVVSGTRTESGYYPVSEVTENYYSWGGFFGPCEKLYRREKLDGIRFREDLPVGEDIIFNLEVLRRIERVCYIPYRGYHIVENLESLTRSSSGRYDLRLDEEFQKRWGDILETSLKQAGIPQKTMQEVNDNGCSVWIFQKIKNYCYPDCPHSYRERIRRIRNQLEENREVILRVKTPISPKTHGIVKLCTVLRSPHVAYRIFRLLVILRR